MKLPPATPSQPFPSLSIPWEFVSNLALQPILKGSAPDQLGAQRLLELRSRMGFSFELPADAFDRGYPAPPLRLFLQQWHLVWPYHAWFLPPGHPLLALLALATAHEAQVIHRAHTSRTNWFITREDYLRFTDAQFAGIRAIAELCRPSSDVVNAQFRSVQTTLARFLAVV